MAKHTFSLYRSSKRSKRRRTKQRKCCNKSRTKRIYKKRGG